MPLMDLPRYLVYLRKRWDRTPDPAITERILEQYRAAEPRLRDTEVLEVTTGLRPDRPSARVEAAAPALS
jgi:hypothetical protein